MRVFALLSTLLLPFGAQAHSDEYLDTVGGVHGGMLRMSGAYHLELVISDGAVTVWVMDHGNAPQTTTGARGQLLLLQGGERITVNLEPQDEGALRGTDPRIVAGTSPRAVLTLSMSGQPPLQLRFAAIDRPAAVVGHDEHAHARH
jgi:hypothetical protein